MCDYCNPENKERDAEGGDCVVYGQMYNNEPYGYYLCIEHFRREVHRIPVNFCPQCGRDLKEVTNV